MLRLTYGSFPRLRSSLPPAAIPSWSWPSGNCMTVSALRCVEWGLPRDMPMVESLAATLEIGPYVEELRSRTPLKPVQIHRRTHFICES